MQVPAIISYWKELSAQLHTLEEQLNHATERWLYLTDLAERIAMQKNGG